LVTTFGGSHSARLTNWESGRILGRWSPLYCVGMTTLRPGVLVGWPGKVIWWQKMDACGE
jgi:hypothetical protein